MHLIQVDPATDPRQDQFVRIVDPSLDKRWDAYVSRHPRGSVYHSSSWMEVLKRTFGYRPICFMAVNGNEVVGCAPFAEVRSRLTGSRLASLPFSDYCEILSDNLYTERAILEAVIEKAGHLRVGRIEIRARDGGAALLQEYGFEAESMFLCHVLPTAEPVDILFKKIHYSYKKSLRKAAKSELTITTASSELELRTYYKLYVRTRRFRGLPPMPYCFFHNIWKSVFPTGMPILLLALYNKSIIAGLLLLKAGDGLYGLTLASNRAFLLKRPNNLLYWRGIEIACEYGLKYFDCGRTSPENEGLLRFKRQWGTREHTITHFVRQTAGSNITLSHSVPYSGLRKGIVQKICKRLPPFVLEMGSSLLYRHWG